MKLDFLKIFNNKALEQGSATQVISTLPASPFDFGSRVGNALQSIYNYLTDEGNLHSSRDLLISARNYAISDPLVSSFLRVMRNNVIGHTGFTLQSKVDSLDDDGNATLNSLLEYEFFQFCKAENFEISKRFNSVDFISLALRNYLVEGEIIIRIYKTGKYGVKLQLLNYNSIDEKKNGKNILNGVELGPETDPIAYWIKDGAGNTKRVDAKEIIHIANIPLDSGKYRGLTFLAPVIPLLKDINTYKKSEITAAIKESTSVLWYGSDPAYGKAYEGAAGGPTSDLAFSRPGATQATPDIEAQKRILASLGASRIQVGGMAVEALPPGVTLNQLMPNVQRSSSEYIKSFYRLLASGLGLSYITLMMDLESANYSGARATAILERPTYKVFRALLIDRIMEPVYRIWLTNYINSNKGLFKKVNNSYESYFEHEFMGLGWDYINPKDDTDSTIAAINAGLQSYTGSLAERGIDIEDHVKTLSSKNETAIRDLIKAFTQPATPQMAPQGPAQAPVEEPEETEAPELEDPSTEPTPTQGSENE